MKKKIKTSATNREKYIYLYKETKAVSVYTTYTFKIFSENVAHFNMFNKVDEREKNKIKERQEKRMKNEEVCP